MERCWQALRWCILIALVGVIAGLGAVFFRDLIAFFHNLLFYGQFSLHYDVLEHAAPSRWGAGIILAPIIGAACVAYLVQNYAPEAKGHGVPEVMDAIYYMHGVVRPVVAIVKSVASSLSIGSGGSIGREGPIIQIGAAFGSALGQWVKIGEKQRIILVACGAGGGIAATFNTPFGGILFALELMLPEISARTLIPVSVATAIATYTSYYFFGNVPFMPDKVGILMDLGPTNVITYIVLSILLGLMAVLFIRSIYFTEDLFDRIPGGYYVRHMVGMGIVGVTMYLMITFFGHYYIQGVGYATVQDVLSFAMDNAWFMLLLTFLKLADTSLTLGSGGSGGVFSPLLFMGATLGGAFAVLLGYLLPGISTISIPLAALAGMAAMVGASTGAPITAIIMTAEMVNNFDIILPLMIIVAIAYGVRRHIMHDSVYTLKLTRRGHHIPDAFVYQRHANN